MSGRQHVHDLNEEVAARIARFKSVFIPYPLHIHLHERCDYLRQLGVLTKGQPQMGLRALGPGGSGKSAAASAYMAAVEARRPRTKTFVPVIKVDLERLATPRKLMMSMLYAFGDPFFDRGNELTLKRRVLEYFILLQTELLIVDEVQHLNYRNGLKNDVTDTLKGLLDAGVIPIVFLGTEDAAPMFSRNLQLNGRLLSPCDLNPLNARSAIDRDLFARFVHKLEEVVVAQGVLPELSLLEAEGALPALFEVSGGVIGRVSRIFHVALEVAIRRGGHRLEVSDLSWAFDHWAVPQAFVARNPLKRAGHG